MKAMILAAGRGERMRPLSDHIPKPLLPVNGKPLIAHHLRALAAANIQDVIINVSHLAHLFQESLGDGTEYGVRIHYSIEPTALETGGGICKVLPLLGDEPFIAVSGDIWTDYPYSQLPSRLTQLAHLVLVDNPFHPDGDFMLQDGILHNNGSPKYAFASIGIYHPDLFKAHQPGTFPLVDVLRPAIDQGKITGEIYQGDWLNVSTPEQWQKLAQRFPK